MTKKTHARDRTKSKRYRVGSKSNKPKYFWRNKNVYYPLGLQFRR